MDILLSKFVGKYIDTFDNMHLTELENFLNFDDETILNFYNNGEVSKKLIKIKFQQYLRT